MTDAPQPERKAPPIPGRIGGVLKVIQTLITHARYFAATVTARAVTVPEFAIVAAVFGTYEIPVILQRVQRGVLRALALQRYLLARAERGRNLRFERPPRTDLQPHHRPPPKPATAPRATPAPKRQPAAAKPGPDDPASFRDLSPEHLDAWVRRRPVGRTIADICLDLGIVPGFCEGAFWTQIYNVLRRYRGSFNRLYEIRAKREESFQKERDRRPETWHIDWRDLSKPTVRTAIGCLVGESPPTPDGPMPGVPAIAPS